MTKIIKHFFLSTFELWSLTDFISDDLSCYAKKQVFTDTRKGIITLSWVLFIILTSSAWLYHFLNFAPVYVYSSSVLAILALHMALSARVIKETQVLYLLAITLIVINGVALVLLAHKNGGFNLALLASVTLLFLVMPLVPWGLREALLIILLIYGIFTASTFSVSGRFDIETLWILQFVMLGASLITLVVISRNIAMRRNDIKLRYELEKSHSQMEFLSLKDPLTNAWNRRFLEQKYTEITEKILLSNKTPYFAVIDIDNFKLLNDQYGHDSGDLVLKQLVHHFNKVLSDNGFLIRMGGDEFAILIFVDDPISSINLAADNFSQDEQLNRFSLEQPITLSIGLIEFKYKQQSLEENYSRADKALYKAKKKKQQRAAKNWIEFDSAGESHGHF